MHEVETITLIERFGDTWSHSPKRDEAVRIRRKARDAENPLAERRRASLVVPTPPALIRAQAET